MDEITTEAAPESIGPFSQGLRVDDRVHVSGQGPVDPETGEIVGRDIEAQTDRTMENVGAILDAGGSSLDRLIRVRVYVTDMGTYDAVNRVYERYVSEPYPARTAVEVSALPIDIGVEIDAIGLVE